MINYIIIYLDGQCVGEMYFRLLKQLISPFGDKKVTSWIKLGFLL